ncbi:helix-turn-helix domain-containing protein [Mucilaginibacter gilvus]|nr:AraC family transcriptional regulator [Mucilaginibacter gilvus]
MDVYFIALLHKGSLTLETDLVSHVIRSPAIYAMAPATIRNITSTSDDFDCEVIFFEEAFFVEQMADPTILNRYECFYNENRSNTTISKRQFKNFSSYFNMIREKSELDVKYNTEIIRNFIQILLLEVATTNSKNSGKNKFTHNQLVASTFNKNLERSYTGNHQVKYYAELQNLSAKYFSRIIQQQTGKTAGDIIDEKIMLEARALLKNRALTIKEIAQLIGFSDASHFGKFYKNLTGFSPQQYRKSMN